MPGPTSRFFFSQRLRLHFVDWGNPEAPPLLLVHGVRDHCRNWDWVAERLRDRWHVLAPDLRGHGDSDWAGSGAYPTDSYVYDLSRLIAQETSAPVTLLGHSLGGNIVLRYAGAYPEKVARIIAIEGLAASPKMIAESRKHTVDQRLRGWIEKQHALADRRPRRYPTLEDAVARMVEENKHLTLEQAQHLTRFGVNRNEDGTYSWKFDNYLRVFPFVEMPPEDMAALWSCVTSPILLVYGGASWASNPLEDGRAAHFRNAKVVSLPGAGHWVHHDRFEEFMALTDNFLPD
jgi:pimeloyl-ACP methyl ester carboxylesterase